MHLGDGSSFIPDTNVIERLNEEFRRRVKTQGALPTEDAALVEALSRSV
jgi:transposase-like protein